MMKRIVTASAPTMLIEGKQHMHPRNAFSLIMWDFAQMANHKDMRWQSMAKHFMAEYKRLVPDYDQDDRLIQKEPQTILQS